MLSKKTVRALLALTMCLLAAGSACACVGARPLSMGGAFTGLADDINATYWNPAGLVQMKEAQGTWMRTSENRDIINYQDYAAAAAPVGKSSAVGVSWISYNWAATDPIDKQDWYWLTVATKLSPNLFVGANIRKIEDSFSNISTGTAIDYGVMCKLSEKVTFGLLVQDANEPDSTDGYSYVTWVRNVRPGIAIHPDDSSVLTFDIYDLNDDGGANSYRVGYERKMTDTFAVRAGYYGLGGDYGKSLTLGFGILKKGTSSDVTKGSSLDVGMMIGDIDTILVSTSLRF